MIHRILCLASMFVFLLLSQAHADMTGSWLFSFSSGQTFQANINESGGEISGNVAITNQPIKGRIHDGGFVFGRHGGGLNVPQFYGGKISDDGSKLTGSFCHNHSDCSQTFTAFRQ